MPNYHLEVYIVHALPWPLCYARSTYQAFAYTLEVKLFDERVVINEAEKALKKVIDGVFIHPAPAGRKQMTSRIGDLAGNYSANTVWWQAQVREKKREVELYPLLFPIEPKSAYDCGVPTKTNEEDPVALDSTHLIVNIEARLLPDSPPNPPQSTH